MADLLQAKTEGVVVGFNVADPILVRAAQAWQRQAALLIIRLIFHRHLHAGA